MNLREVLFFNVNLLSKSVNLSSLRFINREERSFNIFFLDIFKVYNFKEDWILYSESSWGFSVEFLPCEMFK
jgi:hypothetical protein